MKDYFLAFDFYNKNLNKFYYGIVTVDLSDISLKEVAEKVLIDHFYDVVSPCDVTIKITAFNNIN